MTPVRTWTSPPTRNRIIELAFTGKAAAEIFRIIEQEVQNVGAKALPGLSLEVPELRTVQRIVKSVRDIEDATAGSTYWSFDDPQGLDPNLVLDTLSEVTLGTGGRVSYFTVDQAGWMVKIRTSTDGLSGWGAWILYKLCIEATRGDHLDSGLESVLAFKPWVSTERNDAFKKLIETGKIPEPVCWSYIKVRMQQLKEDVFERYEEQ